MQSALDPASSVALAGRLGVMLGSRVTSSHELRRAVLYAIQRQRRQPASGS